MGKSLRTWYVFVYGLVNGKGYDFGVSDTYADADKKLCLRTLNKNDKYETEIVEVVDKESFDNLLFEVNQLLVHVTDKEALKRFETFKKNLK